MGRWQVKCFHLTACQLRGLLHDLDLRRGWGVKAVWQQFTWAARRSRVFCNIVLQGVHWVICMGTWMCQWRGTGPGPHTSFTITPFLLAAELVCRVVVSVVHQAELPREHVHSVPDKQVVGLEAVVSRPPQKYSLVLHIKLLQRGEEWEYRRDKHVQ